MRFPHPKGNIPIRMRQRGQPGITIDSSTDSVSISDLHLVLSPGGLGRVLRGLQGVSDPTQHRLMMLLQASLGTGSLPPGWEKGLAGSCVGERRS